MMVMAILVVKDDASDGLSDAGDVSSEPDDDEQVATVIEAVCASVHQILGM